MTEPSEIRSDLTWHEPPHARSSVSRFLELYLVLAAQPHEPGAQQEERFVGFLDYRNDDGEYPQLLSAEVDDACDFETASFME